MTVVRKDMTNGSVLMKKLDSGAHQIVNVLFYFTCSFPEMDTLKSLHRIILS